MSRPNFYKHHAADDIDLDNVKGGVPLVLVPVAPLAALQHGRIGQDEALEALYRAVVEALKPASDTLHNVPKYYKDHPSQWRWVVEGVRKGLEKFRQKRLIGNARAKDKNNSIFDTVNPPPLEGNNNARNNDEEEEEYYPMDEGEFDIMFSKCQQDKLNPVILAMAVCGWPVQDNQRAWKTKLKEIGRGEFLDRVRFAYEQMAEKENRRPSPSYMQKVLGGWKPHMRGCER